ncbi:MAG: hypothetical protein AAF738_09725, partial [Bacteroidota bacterium]
MKKTLAFLYAFLTIAWVQAQIQNVQVENNLPNSVEETSGLLHFKGNIITHNDSGGAAELYELDPATATVVRTVMIQNATNVDWEDLAEDHTYIYIGDIGNNNGNRTDLKIYRILKSDYMNSTMVMADVINYSYADQTTLTAAPNNNDFDAESLIATDTELVIFSKNWVNEQTKVYRLPKTPGTYVATNSETYNAAGLVTGAATNIDGTVAMLTGYSSNTGSPFVIYMDDFSGGNFFNGNATKVQLSSLGVGSQVEANAHVYNGQYFLTRERFQTTFGGFPITVPASLISLDDENNKLTTEVNGNWIYFRKQYGAQEYVLGVEINPAAAGANTQALSIEVVPHQESATLSATSGMKGTFGLPYYWNLKLEEGTPDGWVNLRLFYPMSAETNLVNDATTFQTASGANYTSPVMYVNANGFYVPMQFPQLQSDGIAQGANPIGTLNGTGTYNGENYYELNQANLNKKNGITALVQVEEENPVPVELVTFQVKAEDCLNTLWWQTASELNFSHFEVERSEDGMHFEQLTKVAGAGNTLQLQTYGYKDAVKTAGTYYYRLKSVDLDATF